MTRDRQRESVAAVAKVCVAIDCLSETDLQHADKMVEDQLSYIHPLKGATQVRTHILGEANKIIVTKLRELKIAIQALKKLPSEQ